MTDDLVTYLLARLYEEEQVARTAANEPLEESPQYLEWIVGSVWYDQYSRFADPARVLAEVAAKRRIVELHKEIKPQPDQAGSTCTTCSEIGPDAQGWPCDTLRLLAQPYANRDDFKTEWLT